MTLGTYIQQLRLEKKYSQRKLALLADVSNTTISRIESDSVTPDLETISKIASALKTDISSFVSYIDSTNSNIIREEKDIQDSFIPTITTKDKKDIAKDLARIKEELLTSEELMFDGHPMSDESIENILSALEIGMEMVRKKNKAKYTPKKYRKN